MFMETKNSGALPSFMMVRTRVAAGKELTPATMVRVLSENLACGASTPVPLSEMAWVV